MEFKWPVKVLCVWPVKASINLIREPLVDTRMDFPSGLNFKPVHSTSLSAGRRTIKSDET